MHQVESVTLPPRPRQPGVRILPNTAPTGAGQIHYITGPTGGVLGFGYDDGGYLASESSDGVTAGAPSGTVETERDPEGRIEQQTVNQLDPVVFTYYADKQLENAGQLHRELDPELGLLDTTTLGVVVDDFTRNDSGEVTGYTASSGMTNVLSIGYERDALGRIKHKTEGVQGGAAVESLYKYDSTGRLWNLCGDGWSASRSAALHSAGAGRLALRRHAGMTEAACARRRGGAGRCRVQLYTPGSGLDSAHGTFDAISDEQDRPRSITFRAATTTYTYPANGDRTSKTDPTGTTDDHYGASGNLYQVNMSNCDVFDILIEVSSRRVGKKAVLSIRFRIRFGLPTDEGLRYM